jgi:hypothetical protein
MRWFGLFVVLTILLNLNLTHAQIVILDRKALEVEPRYLIDCPTANICPRRGIEINFRSFAKGGMLFGMSIGLTERLMIDGGFGGENILGEGPVHWNKSPGVGMRYKIKFEQFQWPAFTIGFNSQGFGAWQDSTNRYRIKSPGFYAVVSKNHTLWKGLGLHGGVNYSLEREDGDDDLNVFVGVAWILEPEPQQRDFVIHAEYDFAINDNGERSMGAGKGYLNAGIKWAFAPEIFSTRLFLEFDVRNILLNTKVNNDNNTKKQYHNRILKIVFMGYF